MHNRFLQYLVLDSQYYYNAQKYWTNVLLGFLQIVLHCTQDNKATHQELSFDKFMIGEVWERRGRVPKTKNFVLLSSKGHRLVVEMANIHQKFKYLWIFSALLRHGCENGRSSFKVLNFEKKSGSKCKYLQASFNFESFHRHDITN